MDLGSYQVTFECRPQAGAPCGKLRDLGGPFAVEGTVTLNPPNAYLVQGFITGAHGGGGERGARDHAGRHARMLRAAAPSPSKVRY
jgi:hypothetical protein